jgi:hypothetical protein
MSLKDRAKRQLNLTPKPRKPAKPARERQYVGPKERTRRLIDSIGFVGPRKAQRR